MGANHVYMTARVTVALPSGRKVEASEDLDLWDGPRSKADVRAIMAAPDKRKATAEWLAANADEPDFALNLLDKFFDDHPASDGWTIVWKAY